jgi:tRNA (uracil-5-)-methyltransferase TRM9
MGWRQGERVNEDTRARLCTINRDFYDRSGAEFSATREHPWPGWVRLAAELPAGRISVLDAACGNGRFAAFLADSREPSPGRLEYLGLDSSQRLLARARARELGSHVRFEQRDLLGTDMAESLPPGPYDLISVFGFLHHVPGFDARRALLAALADRLSERGLLAATVWCFGESERLHGRRMAWQCYNETAAAPIDISQLETGDHLLRWGEQKPSDDGCPPVRYCHLADELEIEQLLVALRGSSPGLRVSSRYRADGKSGDLNSYLLLRRSDG